MTDGQQSKRSSYSRRLGLILLLTPFALVIVAGAALYLWIVSNGYQGDQSVWYAWFVYAVSFLAYFGPIILGVSLVTMAVGIVLMTSKK